MTANQTSFKKGNRASVGNKGGRPKKYDPLIEAEALLEWSKKPEATVLREFAPIRGYAPSLMDLWLKTCPEFLGAYEIAKAWVGVHREKILIENGSSKPFERYADFYDDNLLSHEQSKERYSAEIRSKVEAEVTCKPEEKARHDAIMEQIKALQGNQGPSDAKSAEKSNNTDNKSA